MYVGRDFLKSKLSFNFNIKSVSLIRLKMKRTLLSHYIIVMEKETYLNLFGGRFFKKSLKCSLQQKRSVYQILLVLVLGICFSTVRATTYYVSSTLGNDSNSGISESAPWASLAKVNASTFNAGDQILLKRGDVWRETLTIPNSGTSGKYITFGGYDIGDNPKILGSVQATTWSATGINNVWVSNTIVLDNPYNMYTKAEIFFQEQDDSVKWGNYKTYSDLSELTTEYDWTWAGNHVYVYATSDPDSRYISVEVPQRINGIELNDKEYITIDGVDVFYQIQAGVRESYSARDLNGLIIKNCEIAYNGVIESTFAVGMSVWHSDMLIQNNTIHDCGRRGVSINLDNSGDISLNNVIIEQNHFYNGFHTTGTDISNIGPSTFNNIIVRYNNFEGSKNRKEGSSYDPSTNTYPHSNHIYSANTSTGSINNLYILNNIFTYCYGAGAALQGVDTSYVYNNTFYGFNTTLSTGTGQIYYMGVHKSAVVRNNLFYNDADHNVNQFLLCIYSTKEASPNVDIDYNLYYCIDPYISVFTNGSSFYKISQWPTYKSTTGWDAGSPVPANPMFESSTDYRLKSSSIAINAGVNVDLTRDYQGNPIVGTPDLGAFEYGANKDVTPPVISAFTIPATSTSLSVPISVFTATDDIGVTGYLLTETSATPTVEASGWSSGKPTTYTFSSTKSTSAETKSLYAWARDEAGNVSVSLSASVTISSLVNTVYSTEDISICEGSSYGFDEELVTNGDFSTSGSWTLGNSAVIGSGILSLKGASMYVYQNVSVENGSTYRLTYEITEAKSIDGLYLSYNGFVASSTKIPYTLGVHSVDIVCKDDTKPLQIVTSTTATNDVGIDNISLKKVWTTTGQYQRTLTGISGADSIVTTNLTVNPVYNITEDIIILEGESYLGWTESGQYKRTLTSVSGCDSIITTNLTVKQLKNQSIELEEGRNIFSTYLIPIDSNLNLIFESLQTNNQLSEVQDENGNIYSEGVDGWSNNIEPLQKTKGYKIKVNSSCVLQIEGYSILLPLDIELKEGWNIISSPYNGTVDALDVVKPLIDVGILEKVQDERGNSIENWGELIGWINSIGNFKAGEGYLIQVNKSGVLSILESYTKSAVFLVEEPIPTHFEVAYEGNGSGHMNINIIGIIEANLQIGDEIAAYDDGVCVGAVSLNEANIENGVVSVHASVSDQNITDGFTEGNPIELRIWNAVENEETSYQLNVISGELVYQKQGSVFVQLDEKKKVDELSDSELFNMYPNPANDVVTIQFTSLPERQTIIELINMSGMQLIHREVQSTREVLDIQSQPPGVYLVKIESNNSCKVKKLIKN